MCFPKPKSAQQTTPAYVPPAQVAVTNAGAEVKGSVAGTSGSASSGQQDNIQAQRRRRRASANLGL